ncbi:hypothetical protein AT6N2_C1213 [Agrobacterium tumefaciens]|nr:hypothetical protein AT6N2_C1213 [Agrobacterium tumefaciens]
MSLVFVHDVFQAGLEVIIAGIHGKGRGEPEQRDAHFRSIRQHLVAGGACEQKGDGDHLNSRLPLGDTGDGDADLQRRQIFAQARDENFTAKNGNRSPQRPAGNRAIRRHQKQHGSDQQLVGDRVQHAADIRRLVPDTRQIAIEKIGKRGDDEQPQRRPAGKIRALQFSFDIKAKDDDRNGENPAVGQEVGNAVCARSHGETCQSEISCLDAAARA